MQGPGKREPGRSVLAVFRPTWRQAIGRGLYAGAAVAAVTFLLALALPTAYRWAVVLVPTVAAAAGGAVVVRHRGIEADEHGLRRTSDAAGDGVPWKRVVGIRAEWHHRRTVVMVSLDAAETVRLPAPYDGAWLAHDPLFERRLFMLRHLWETHRDWSVRG